MNIKQALRIAIDHHRLDIGQADDQFCQAELLEEVAFDGVLDSEDQEWISIILQRLQSDDRNERIDARVAVNDLFRELGEFDIEFDL